MVADLLLTAVVFLLGGVAGYLLAHLREKPKVSFAGKMIATDIARTQTPASVPIGPQNVVARLLGFKPDPAPQPPQKPITETISRSRGSWRRQRQALQAQFNTKQKERDALTRPLTSKEKSNVG